MGRSSRSPSPAAPRRRRSARQQQTAAQPDGEQEDELFERSAPVE